MLKKYLLILGAVLPILFLSILLCSFSSTNNSDRVYDTEKMERSSKLIEAYLSKNLVSDEVVSQQIFDEIDLIYESYGDSIPVLYFSFNFAPNKLVVSLTEKFGDYTRIQIAEILRGIADKFNAKVLNKHNTEVADLFKIGDKYYAQFYFPDYLNPVSLIDSLENLPEIEYAGLNGIAGDGSKIIPFTFPTGRAYLFYKGKGDCPSGCINREYWYFKFVNEKLQYIGYWNNQNNQNNSHDRDYRDDKPDWLKELKLR